jgi:hypothetical protein
MALARVAALSADDVGQRGKDCSKLRIYRSLTIMTLADGKNVWTIMEFMV